MLLMPLLAAVAARGHEPRGLFARYLLHLFDQSSHWDRARGFHAQ